MNIYRLFFTILTVIFIISCQNKNKSDTSINTEVKTEAKSKVENLPSPNMHQTESLEWQQASVKYIRLEGGFYGLITLDGRKYLPLNLAKQYRQDGAVIHIKGEIDRNVSSIYQWGEPFEIKELKLIKPGRIKVESNE